MFQCIIITVGDRGLNSLVSMCFSVSSSLLVINGLVSLCFSVSLLLLVMKASRQEEDMTISRSGIIASLTKVRLSAMWIKITLNLLISA